jgi:hypothetical protein
MLSCYDVIDLMHALTAAAPQEQGQEQGHADARMVDDRH